MSEKKGSLGEDIYWSLQKHYPEAFDGKIEDIARACGELTICLGGMTKLLETKVGMVAARAAFDAMIEKARREADMIEKIGKEMAASSSKTDSPWRQ